MYELENFLATIDGLLDTKRKRHIFGGILISLAALFGGLAATTLTIRPEDEKGER